MSVSVTFWLGNRPLRHFRFSDPTWPPLWTAECQLSGTNIYKPKCPRHWVAGPDVLTSTDVPDWNFKFRLPPWRLHPPPPPPLSIYIKLYYYEPTNKRRVHVNMVITWLYNLKSWQLPVGPLRKNSGSNFWNWGRGGGGGGSRSSHLISRWNGNIGCCRPGMSILWDGIIYAYVDV